MKLDRREFIASGAAALAASSLASVAYAQPIQKIRFAFGFKTVNPIVINILIGEGLGYHKQEGFTLQPLGLSTGANVQIALAKGDVDFSVGIPSFQLPLFARNELPDMVNFYEYTYPYKWDVAVKPGSPIQKYEDLRGKKIGVSDLGVSDYPVTRAVLGKLGINPDTDVSWLAVGTGVSAGAALDRGNIDALAHFDTGFGLIEGAGIKLRILPRPPEVPLIGGLFLTAMSDYLKNNRKLAVGLGRSVAKSSEFILANPAAGAKVFLDMFPETAPRGATTEKAIEAILYSVNRRKALYRPPYPNTKMGYIRPEELLLEAQFQNLDIKDVSKLYTNDLIDEINAFDREAIIAEAKAFKV